MKAILRSGFLALAIMALTVPANAGPFEVDRVIAEAREECSEVNNGKLTYSDGFVSDADITGDGNSEQIISYGRFACSTAPTLYRSDGGSPLAIIVGEKNYSSFLL